MGHVQHCYSGVGLKMLACATHGFTFYLVKNVLRQYTGKRKS
jgi:hypothetical protein